MMTAQQIKELIEAGVEGAQAVVIGDDGQHFQARVIAAAFEGKSVVAQHRMVYEALGGRMGGEIHALALKTETPAAT